MNFATTTDARNELMRRMTPCRVCHGVDGSPVADYSDATVKDILDRDDEMRTTPSGRALAEHIFAIPVICKSCEKALRFANSTERKRIMLAKLEHRTYAGGLLPKDERKTVFATSRPDVEARNPAAWAMAKKAPLDQGLWLWGHPSTGKTHMALCVANNYLEHGLSAAFLNCTEINALAQWEFESKLQHYVAARLLIIDDIATPTWRPAGIDALYHVVNERYGKDTLRLIVTANADGKATVRALRKPRPDNPSVAIAILERMRPMVRMEITGDSLRDVAADDRYSDDE